MYCHMSCSLSCCCCAMLANAEASHCSIAMLQTSNPTNPLNIVTLQQRQHQTKYSKLAAAQRYALTLSKTIALYIALAAAAQKKQNQQDCVWYGASQQPDVPGHSCGQCAAQLAIRLLQVLERWRCGRITIALVGVHLEHQLLVCCGESGLRGYVAEGCRVDHVAVGTWRRGSCRAGQQPANLPGPDLPLCKLQDVLFFQPCKRQPGGIISNRYGTGIITRNIVEAVQHLG